MVPYRTAQNHSICNVDPCRLEGYLVSKHDNHNSSRCMRFLGDSFTGTSRGGGTLQRSTDFLCWLQRTQCTVEHDGKTSTPLQSHYNTIPGRRTIRPGGTGKNRLTLVLVCMQEVGQLRQISPPYFVLSIHY